MPARIAPSCVILSLLVLTGCHGTSRPRCVTFDTQPVGAIAPGGGFTENSIQVTTGPSGVAAVRPAVALVSVGAGNPYGHPNVAMLDLLRREGATVLRTDLDGAVMLLFAPGAARVAAVQREVQRRYWYDPPRASAAPIE